MADPFYNMVAVTRGRFSCHPKPSPLEGKVVAERPDEVSLYLNFFFHKLSSFLVLLSHKIRVIKNNKS